MAKVGMDLEGLGQQLGLGRTQHRFLQIIQPVRHHLKQGKILMENLFKKDMEHII